MSKEKEDLPTTFIHETEEYSHEDINGVDKDHLEPDSFRTVSLPNGNKMIVAKNKKTKQLEGVRILIRKTK